MNEFDGNSFVVTCTEVNEDGSAIIEVEAGSEMAKIISGEGINFLLLKGILKGNTDDIFRWAQRGKQEENADTNTHE
jgi:hypothetical protein